MSLSSNQLKLPIYPPSAIGERGRPLHSCAVPDQPLESRYRARSLWLDGLEGPLAPRPSLTESADCDVAVVGAGFTGLWAAYYLKRHQPGLRVTVVEREIAGYGPSGRNGGWVSFGVSGSPSVYARAHGRDAVARGQRATPRRSTRSARWPPAKASTAAS